MSSGIMKKTGRVQKITGRKLPQFLFKQKQKKPPSIQMERRPSANQSDNLWRNYKNLLYLESSRDEILQGVHRRLAEIEETNVEPKIRKESFQSVDKESDTMFEQIRQVFLRLPRLATYDRHLLETCIKIVNCEERKDMKSTENDGHPAIPGRPKRWKDRCLEIIKSEVVKRAAETAPSHDVLEEDRDGSRLLVQLVKARADILKDLEHAEALNPLFTEDWDMYNTYVMTYYDSVMSLIHERFSFDLNQAETIQVLSWMILCRDRVFNCQNAHCPPCLMIVKLQEKFLNETSRHIHEWMEKALQRDIRDWRSEEKPLAHSETLYTHFPLDILKMLEENMNQAKNISLELHGRISELCLKELDAIMEVYTANVKSYISQEQTKPPRCDKVHHRASPILNLRGQGARKNSKETRPTHFEQYAIALLNNFDKISGRLHEITKEVGKAQKEFKEDSRNNNNTQLGDEPVQKLIQKIEAQMQDCSRLLPPKLLNDISSELATLLTRNWLAGNGREAVDIMCDVMTSYLRHLREPVRRLLMPEIEEKLIVGYMTGLTDKRIRVDGNKRQRLDLFDKICRECQQLERCLQGFSSLNGQTSRWDVVREFAGLVQVEDQQTINTDLIVLASKYPDFTEKQARRVLRVRGDFTKAQVKTIVSTSLGKKRKSVKGQEKKTVFSKLPST